MPAVVNSGSGRHALGQDQAALPRGGMPENRAWDILISVATHNIVLRLAGT